MPGDSGIFATCNKGRESKCVGELRDLFSEYATQLYGDGDGDDGDDDDDDGGATSIENDIQAELAGIHKPAAAPLFVPVKLDVQCGEFLELTEEREKKKRKKKKTILRSREVPSFPSSRSAGFRFQHPLVRVDFRSEKTLAN